MRPISLPEPLAGHAAPITNVAFSPSGALLATSSYDGSVLIWHDLSGRAPLPGARLRHRRLVNGASWSPEHPGLLATASADKTIGIWRVSAEGLDATPLGHLAWHTDDVNAVAWLPDGERLVSASEDSTALLWEWRSGRYLGRLSAHAGHCMAVAVSPGGLVLSVGEDGAVFVAAPGRPGAASVRHFPTSIEHCAWSPGGEVAALAGDDGVIRLVSPELDLLEEFPVATSAARAVCFVGRGAGELVVGSYDASVARVSGGEVLARRRGGRLWPRSLDVGGTTVAVGSFGASPVLLELARLVTIHDGGPSTTGPNALASSGGEVAIGLDSGAVLVVPTSSLLAGTTTGALQVVAAEDPVLSLAPTRRGWLAGTYGGCLVEFTSHGPTRELDLGAPLPSLASFHDGEGAYAGSYNGEIHHIALGGAELAVSGSLRVHEGSVKSLAFLERGIVSGATDAAVRLSPRGLGEPSTLWYHGNLVNAVATDARGLVASASRDRLVRLGGPGWEGPPANLQGGDESMKAVALLGGGSEIVVLGGSYDFALFAWHLRGGEIPDARAGEVVAEAGQGIATILALDSAHALAACWDGTIRLLELVDGRVAERARLEVAELLEAAGARRVGGREDVAVGR